MAETTQTQEPPKKPDLKTRIKDFLSQLPTKMAEVGVLILDFFYMHPKESILLLFIGFVVGAILA